MIIITIYPSPVGQHPRQTWASIGGQGGTLFGRILVSSKYMLTLHLIYIIYMYIYVYTHIYIYTHTHTHIYIYNIYIFLFSFLPLPEKIPADAPRQMEFDGDVIKASAMLPLLLLCDGQAAG